MGCPGMELVSSPWEEYILLSTGRWMLVSRTTEKVEVLGASFQWCLNQEGCNEVITDLEAARSTKGMCAPPDATVGHQR